MILEILTVDDDKLEIALHANFLVTWPTLNRSRQKKVLIANGKGSIANLKKKTKLQVIFS